MGIITVPQATGDDMGAVTIPDSTSESDEVMLSSTPLYKYVTQTIRFNYERFINSRGHNLAKLEPLQWLNDDVLDFYFYNILQPIANVTNNRTVFIGNHFMDSLSNTKITEKQLMNLVLEDSNMIRATLRQLKLKKVHETTVSEVGRIVTGVNVSNIHWVLMVIDFDRKKIAYLDPLSGGSRDRKAKYVTARTIKVLIILEYIDESDI
jgi:Ulp1 family protease